MSKYLSIDLESTGLEDWAYIVEFGAVPICTKTRAIRTDLSFHAFLSCPSFEELSPKISQWVKEHNEGLIRTAHETGLSKEDFLKAFDEYMKSEAIVNFFEGEKPLLMGKSLSALDIPLLSRDFGRDDFMKKYFYHRNLDVSCVAAKEVDKGTLPEGCTSSQKLAQHFGLGDDVDHTSISDAVNVAKMYFKILDL